MAKGTTLLDKNKNIVYPRTIIEQVYNKAGTARLDVLLSTMRENLEGDIADTNVVVARLRADLDALLSDSTLSGEVLDAIVEIKTLLDSNSSDVVAGLVETMSALRDEAVRNVAQELTLSQKQQARQNIDAVGVSATYGDGLATISFNGNAIYPETKGSQVKLSIGGNAEDAIKANGGNIEKERVRAIAREDEIAEGLAETKEKVDTFLGDADTSEQAIDKLKELQDYIKNDETSASQMLGDIAQNKKDIADNAEALEKEATRAKQVEMYLESQKANKYGYYENLSVGVSDNLSGRGEATESEFAMRPSGGENKSIEDGTARINSIKGNSVVLNQLVNNVVTNDLGETGWYVRQGNDKAVVSGNKITITFTRGTSDQPLLGQRLSLKSNRKYYIKITYEVPKLDQYNRALQVSLDSAYSASSNYEVIGALNGYNNTKQTVSAICNGIDEKPYLIIKPRNFTNDVGEKMSCEVEVTDITKMFNGVNEPTTVEEFELLYGNMSNEYNAGTIIDNHTTAIKSVGVNAWDEEWESGAYNIWNEEGDGSKVDVDGYTRCKNHIPVIPNMTYSIGAQSYASQYHVGFYDGDKNYIAFATFIQQTGNYRTFTTPPYCHYITFYTNYATYNHDICIHLVHTGYLNGKYFPYESQIRQLPTVEGGLKSAGTAYDEIRYNKGKDKWEHVQRIGQVDLGELDWSIFVDKRFYSSDVVGMKGTLITTMVGNMRCAKYIALSASNTYNGVTGISQSQLDGGYFLIWDASYTDASALRQDLRGVICYYELAEPVVTELDVDISPDYKVWDYGTEEAISEVLSTPVRINTNYGFNAVGQITDNTELIKELLARVAVLEAQIAQANSVSVNVEPIVE